MSRDPDPRVDAYIDALPDWQQAICRKPTARRACRATRDSHEGLGPRADALQEVLQEIHLNR